MKYFLFCRVYSCRMILDSLENIDIKRIFVWREEYAGMKSYIADTDVIDTEEHLSRYVNEESVFIVEGEREYARLSIENARPHRVVTFYDRKKPPLGCISKDKWDFLNRQRNTTISMNRLQRAAYRGLKPYRAYSQKKEQNRTRNNLHDIASYLRDWKNNFMIIVSSENDRRLLRLCENIPKCVGGFNIDSLSGHSDRTLMDIGGLNRSEMLGYDYFCTNYNQFRKIEELLENYGVRKDNICVIGDASKFTGSGGAVIDVFDPLIGNTRVLEGELPGYVIFRDPDQTKTNDRAFRILTLGGSTSDPTTANVKSWSELLFDALRDMGIAVEIWAGGVVNYVAEQELKKLIREGGGDSPGSCYKL